jgi:drug/metabolite transporter (DMT)-like permease
MVGSGLAFVGVNAIVRALGTDLPAAQSAFIRYAFGVLFFLPMLPGLLRQGLPAGALPLLAWRGVVHTAAVVFWIFAMARIPLAHVTAIGYLSPVILLLAGALLLGEGLTRRRIFAVGLAVIGTLVVLRPGLEPVGIGHLGQMAAATCFAGSYLFAKKLSGFVPASVVVAMLTFTVTLGLLPLALLDWRPVPGWHLAGLAVVALLATLGHYLMSRAFGVAPLTVTQPVTFLNLVWAALMGSLLFQEPVDIWVILGGGLIIGAISWVTWRERSSPTPTAET